MNNNEGRLELLSNAIVILKGKIKRMDIGSDEYQKEVKLLTSLEIERDNLLETILTEKF